MSGFTAVGIAFNTVTTDQQCPLGFELTIATANNGNRIWIYVFNDDPTNAFAEGTVVFRDPSAATQDFYGATITPASTSVATPFVIGVAQHAIAVGSYGFVLKKGVGKVLAGSAGLAADTQFTSGGSAVGTVLAVVADANAITDTHSSVIGHGATVIGAAATGTAFISCAG